MSIESRVEKLEARRGAGTDEQEITTIVVYCDREGADGKITKTPSERYFVGGEKKPPERWDPETETWQPIDLPGVTDAGKT